jgi:murein DD-endopeptidase MepM/ murein hydrolase activator NlpD
MGMPVPGRAARRRNEAALFTALLLLGLPATAGRAGGTPAAFPEVEIGWFPEEPKQGEVLHVWVCAPEGVRVEGGRLLSRRMYFSRSPKPEGRWDALVGIDMAQAPGTYKASIRLASAGGGPERDKTATIRVLPQAFGEERLTVADSQVHLSANDLARANREKARISSLLSEETGKRLWEGPFLVPVEGRPGSPFGLRRWINGERRSPHTGMDIKAPEGEPVQAANSGRVALVGDFFFSGKSVFLDHGQGVYSMYFHLSKIQVVEGQELEKGEVLGLVGMTGRATGPHLHWGVRVGGACVDPVSLVERTKAGL